MGWWYLGSRNGILLLCEFLVVQVHVSSQFPVLSISPVLTRIIGHPPESMVNPIERMKKDKYFPCRRRVEKRETSPFCITNNYKRFVDDVRLTMSSIHHGRCRGIVSTITIGRSAYSLFLESHSVNPDQYTVHSPGMEMRDVVTESSHTRPLWMYTGSRKTPQMF